MQQENQSYQVASFYKFAEISNETLDCYEKHAYELSSTKNILGLIVIGQEGINGTISGESSAITEFIGITKQMLGMAELESKLSFHHKHPFARFKIDKRPEIITAKSDSTELSPPESYLNPTEWNKMLEEHEVVVVDTRNFYETDIGMFKGAIDPKITKFSEFSEYVAKSDLPRDKKIMLYCTGGIRCEKAVVDMRKQGFENVYQLHGGILKYLEEYPEGQFDGECFIFDHRVALNSQLKPTEIYRLCPHCGNPGKEHIKCRKCDSAAVICSKCQSDALKIACSKNCAHHLKLAEKKAAAQKCA